VAEHHSVVVPHRVWGDGKWTAGVDVCAVVDGAHTTRVRDDGGIDDEDVLQGQSLLCVRISCGHSHASSSTIYDRLVIMHAETRLVGMQRTAMVRNVTRPLRNSVVRVERRSLTLKYRPTCMQRANVCGWVISMNMFWQVAQSSFTTYRSVQAFVSNMLIEKLAAHSETRCDRSRLASHVAVAGASHMHSDRTMQPPLSPCMRVEEPGILT
jgi:hypothetical protein